MKIEKLNNLRAMADKVEPYSYMRQFSAEQLEQMKTDFLNQSIKLAALDAELDEVKKDYKEQMKPIKQEVGTLMTNLKQKAESVTEDCFVEFDRENNKANLYSPSTGDLVCTRPLTASEMQLNLKLKTGTED